MGQVSGKDEKGTGEDRKDRLAAELRNNLKRRKAKTKDTGTSQASEADEAGQR